MWVMVDISRGDSIKWGQDFNKLFGGGGKTQPTIWDRQCLVWRKTAKLSCKILNSHQQWMRVLIAPQPCKAVGIVRFLDFRHSNRCVVVSHYCFNLHFPKTNDVEHVFYDYFHLYILFDEVSIHIVFPFLNWVVALLSFKSSLYILDTAL